MAIIKLYGFDGDAEILGVSRRVVFTEEGLLIKGLTLLEANQFLNVVATDDLKGVVPSTAVQDAMRDIVAEGSKKQSTKVVEEDNDDDDKKERPAKHTTPSRAVEKDDEDDDNAEEKQKKSPRQRGRPPGKKTSSRTPPSYLRPRAPKKASSIEEELEDDPPSPSARKRGKGRKVQEEKEAKDYVAGHDKPDGSLGHPLEFDIDIITDDVFDKIAACKRLSDVLTIIAQDCGVKNPAIAFAICEELKDEIPVIAKADRLEARITARYQVFDDDDEDD